MPSKRNPMLINKKFNEKVKEMKGALSNLLKDAEYLKENADSYNEKKLADDLFFAIENVIDIASSKYN